MDAPDELRRATIARFVEAPAAVQLLVIGHNALECACMVAGLADAPGLAVEACTDPAGRNGFAPELILLQDFDDRSGGSWLGSQLHIVAQQWPAARTMVLATGTTASLRLCRASRVCACLPLGADCQQILAAILIVRAGLIVYPPEVLVSGHEAAVRARRAAEPVISG